MILFDLDGTLANCDHRRHFIIQPKLPECTCSNLDSNCAVHDWVDKYGYNGEFWKPNWEAFFQACDKDIPIKPVINIFNHLAYSLGVEGRDNELQIWSGRCESVRKKTEDWLLEHTEWCHIINLKMRPVGDYTPDDRPKVLRMWQWNGIFTFDVGQGCEEF